MSVNYGVKTDNVRILCILIRVVFCYEYSVRSNAYGVNVIVLSDTSVGEANECILDIAIVIIGVITDNIIAIGNLIPICVEIGAVHCVAKSVINEICALIF